MAGGSACRRHFLPSSHGMRRRARACLLQVLLHLLSPVSVVGSYFCGTDWADARQRCDRPCPSERNEECMAGEECFGYTGCAPPAAEDLAGAVVAGGDSVPAGNGNACGASWIQAMLSCATRCPQGDGCPFPQRCYAATNCDKPIEPVMSKMLMSLLGDFPGSVEMEYDAQVLFSEAVLEHLAAALEEHQVSINGAEVTGQSLSFRDGRGRGRRRARVARQERPRALASTSLDVSMNIKGEYRPPPYKNLNLLVEDSINAASRQLVQDCRDRGRRAGTDFFESVEGLEAKREADTTPPPTPWPTARPTTLAPVSGAPSPTPTRDPSVSPTSAPTRAGGQVARAGAGAELYEDTSMSYGIVFEVASQPAAETLIVKGLDIYVNAPGEVSYEVWSKEGGWKGFEGDVETFAKVAEGTVISPGKCTDATEDTEDCTSHFSTIPLEEFENVAIRGGGGSRSFYITLTTRELLYSLSESSDIAVKMETPDLVVYEGAGVVMYPFSEATNTNFYREPRGFLGRIWYERNPCIDGGMEWPCETRSPASLLSPITSELTANPTLLTPTAEPTMRGNPTASAAAPDLTPEAQNRTGGDGDTALVPAPETQERVDRGAEVGVESEETPALSIPPIPTPVEEYQLYDTHEENFSILTLSLLKCRDTGDGENSVYYPMNNAEEEIYREVMRRFLHAQPSLEVAAVTIIDVDVYNQYAVNEDHELCSTGRRYLASTEDTNGVSMDVVTRIERDSVLPSDVVDLLLTHLIEDQKDVLIANFREESLPYFHGIVDISRRIATETSSSSDQTQESETVAARNEEDNAETGVASSLLIGGLVGGLPWILLALCGLVCLVKMRRERKRNHLARDHNEQSTEEVTSDGCEARNPSGSLVQFDVEAGNTNHAKSEAAVNDDEDTSDSDEGEDSESSDERDGTELSKEEDGTESNSDEEETESYNQGDEIESDDGEGEENESHDEEDYTNLDDEKDESEPLVDKPVGDSLERRIEVASEQEESAETFDDRPHPRKGEETAEGKSFRRRQSLPIMEARNKQKGQGEEVDDLDIFEDVKKGKDKARYKRSQRQQSLPITSSQNRGLEEKGQEEEEDDLIAPKVVAKEIRRSFQGLRTSGLEKDGKAPAWAEGPDAFEERQQKIQEERSGEGSPRQQSQHKNRTTHVEEEERAEDEDLDDLIARKIAAKRSGKTFSRRASQQGFNTSEERRQIMRRAGLQKQQSVPVMATRDRNLNEQEGEDLGDLIAMVAPNLRRRSFSGLRTSGVEEGGKIPSKSEGQDAFEEGPQQKMARAKTEGRDYFAEILQAVSGEDPQGQQSQDTDRTTHAEEETRDEGEKMDDLIARKVAAKKIGKSTSRRGLKQGLDKSHADEDDKNPARAEGPNSLEERVQRKLRRDSLRKQQSRHTDTLACVDEENGEEGEDVDDLLTRKVARKKSIKSLSRRQSHKIEKDKKHTSRAEGPDALEDKIQRSTKEANHERRQSKRKISRSHVKEEQRDEQKEMDDVIARKIGSKSSNRNLRRSHSRRADHTAQDEKALTRADGQDILEDKPQQKINVDKRRQHRSRPSENAEDFNMSARKKGSESSSREISQQRSRRLSVTHDSIKSLEVSLDTTKRSDMRARSMRTKSSSCRNFSFTPKEQHGRKRDSVNHQMGDASSRPRSSSRRASEGTRSELDPFKTPRRSSIRTKKGAEELGFDLKTSPSRSDPDFGSF